MRNIIVRALLSLIILSFLVISIIININLRSDNNDFKEKITDLEGKIKELKSAKVDQNNNFCTFIKTLKIVDILDYEAAVPEDVFILVDAFQSFTPFVLRVDREYLSKLTKDKYYEFTFNGPIKIYNNSEDASLSNFRIISINETNKEGLDQIQEACK
jgi:hypothetical protein